MTDTRDVSRTSRFTGKTAKSLNEAAAVHRIPRPPRIAGWPAYKGNRIKASGGPMTRTPSVLVLSVLVLSVLVLSVLVPSVLGLFLSVALMSWTLGGLAEASTWHSAISIDGFYCYCADGSRGALRNARAAASRLPDAVPGKAPANEAPLFAKLAARMQEGFAALLFKIYKLAAHA